MAKNILLSDRGCTLVDAILANTDWNISILIVDYFGGYSKKYASCPRIQSVMTLSEIIDWDGEIDLDFEDVEDALPLFHACDYGARRIMDDFHFSRYQFFQSLGFWRWQLTHHQIDLCVITNNFHGFPNDYALEKMALRQHVPCLHVTPIFNNRLAVYSGTDLQFLRIGQCVDTSSDLEKIAHYSVNVTGGLYQLPFQPVVRAVYGLFGAFGIRLCRFLWKRKQTIHYHECTMIEYVRLWLKIGAMARYARKKYCPVDYSKPYVVFFLHFEPEAVVTEHATVDSQLALIRMISDALPDGWTLYVKEHPDLYKYNQWRFEYHIPSIPTFMTKYFYDKLESMKRVRLLDYKEPASELIKHAEAISTIAGTVMTEAILNHTPILMFAGEKHIYSKCPDIFRIRSSSDIKAAFDKIRDGFTPDYSVIPELVSEYTVEDQEAQIDALIRLLNNGGIDFGKRDK